MYVSLNHESDEFSVLEPNIDNLSMARDTDIIFYLFYLVVD